MNILIKDVDIITHDTAAEACQTGQSLKPAVNCRVIKAGNIGISGSKFAFVSGAGGVPEGFKADKVISGRHRLALPGLVNAHTHCAMTLMRNYADDCALDEWLFERIFPVEGRLSDEDVYWGTLLGIAEMLASGTTTFTDMYLHMDSVARAVEESGIRANLSRNPVKIGEGRNPELCDDTGACFDYYNKWNGSANGRIKVYVEVHSAYLFNEESLRNAACLAKNCNTGIHMHINETEGEREKSLARYGMGTLDICRECGILDVPVIAAHCVHLSDADMRILKAFGINAVHNPTSNLKLGSGIAPVPDMLDMGINVCLGTDGPASNNNLDMFEELRLAALLHKGTRRNPELVSASQALNMATINGAAASGFSGVSGVIREGFKADLLLLDTDKPHFYPMNDAVSAVVYTASGADVDTVIVDGQILFEGRQYKQLDFERIKFEVGNITRRLYG